MPNNTLPTNGDQQAGPWWSRILTNRSAVIAAVALYLVYFLTQQLTGGVNAAQEVGRDTQAVLINHANVTAAAHDAAVAEMKKLLREATLQTRLMREVCWSNAKNDLQRQKCYDSDVYIPGAVR